MKKLLSILLALLTCICALGGAALAEADVISGNISAGGVAAKDQNGALYFAMEGLKRLNPDGSITHVADGSPRCLQAAGGAVYYVLRVEDPQAEDYDSYIETLWMIDEGGMPVQIGEARPVYTTYAYDEADYHLSESTSYNGYGDMTVYDGFIYFVGTDDTPGTYLTDATQWGEGFGVVETAYAGGAAIFRMDLDGENLTPIITGLGNGRAHMAICSGRIAVASCFRNAVFAYDFVNFMFYDMNGAHIETIPNTSPERHSWLFKEEEEFTVLVNSIQTDGERIYASVSESEGDFASSRLVDVTAMEETIAIEAFYAPSLVTPAGLFYITADVEDTFWEEDMEYTTVLRRRTGDGADILLAHIPHTYVGYDMQMALLGDELYLCSRDLFRSYLDAEAEMSPESGVLLRVKLENGAVDELTDLGFSVSMACDPEFYTPPVLAWQTNPAEAQEDVIEGVFLLPDSDVYIYSEEELSMYSAGELALMRNEILARHGYVFQKEAYREYFSGQSWYEENPDFSYDDLNAVEMENVETIKKLEEKAQ